MLFIRIVFLLFLFVPVCMQSQMVDTELDKKYTPNENSPFNLAQIKRDGGITEPEITFANSLKYCPTMLIRRKLYFSYERRLFKPLTLTIGAGKAFGGDFIQGTYLGAEGLLGGSSNNVVDLSTLYVYSNYYDSGFLLSAGLRLYFSGIAFDEGFVEFFYRHETLDYLLENNVSGYPVIGDNRLEYNMNSFSLGYGYQFTSGKKNKFTHEFALNTGYKFFTYTQFDKISTSGSSPYKIVRSNNVISAKLFPTINLSYSLGFGF